MLFFLKEAKICENNSFVRPFCIWPFPQKLDNLVALHLDCSNCSYSTPLQCQKK